MELEVLVVLVPLNLLLASELPLLLRVSVPQPQHLVLERQLASVLISRLASDLLPKQVVLVLLLLVKQAGLAGLVVANLLNNNLLGLVDLDQLRLAASVLPLLLPLGSVLPLDLAHLLLLLPDLVGLALLLSNLPLDSVVGSGLRNPLPSRLASALLQADSALLPSVVVLVLLLNPQLPIPLVQRQQPPALVLRQPRAVLVPLLVLASHLLGSALSLLLHSVVKHLRLVSQPNRLKLPRSVALVNKAPVSAHPPPKTPLDKHKINSKQVSVLALAQLLKLPASAPPAPTPGPPAPRSK